jgi:AcrR family transcriptional regulator
VNPPTVDWSSLRGPDSAPPPGGLRERKKWRLRQQLSGTATAMFLQRGFDAVRVTEIAEACDVSEKTVFNYFPTKESLLLDRWDTTMASLRTTLADPALAPVEAALRILSSELTALTSWLAAQDDPAAAQALMLRFGDLLRSTPSLRAHQYDTTERLITVAAEALAARAGLDSGDPEPRIAATALLGLWAVQFQSLRRQLGTAQTPERIHQTVTAEVGRAARLLDAGLDAWPS